MNTGMPRWPLAVCVLRPGLVAGIDNASGLGHAPEHQADTHVGGKNHAQPGEVGKLRFFTFSAETDQAVI